jgi:general secretion pathway protein D
VGGGATTYALFLPGAVLNLSHLASSTRSWRRVDLRAREGKEATLFIGDRVPIVTGVFTSVLPVQPGQPDFNAPPTAQYEQIGLRVSVTPRLHSRTEMTLLLKLEDKQIGAQAIPGLPVIANRVVEQQVRLKEGETLLLAGMQDQTIEKSITGTPGLSALPVIGHLFKRTAPHTRNLELVVLLTPRIVRLPARQRLAMRTLPVGTEREFSPEGPAPAAAPTAPPPAAPTPPGQPPPGQPQPPQPRPQQPQTPQPQPPQPQPPQN